MSIWSNVDTAKASGEFNIDSGGDPLPNNTTALAYIKDALWKEYEGEEYINLTWSILKPEEYKNRTVFQKIKVKDLDKAKQERAIMMLCAIDLNTGGSLPKESDPTDTDLARCLLKKPMVINIMQWEINDKKGNWVNKVSPKKASTQVDIPDEPVIVSSPTQSPSDLGEDDDIPF